ncbi:MAG: EAL domain-containing protein [Firmicutes bacterium]|nr:EAL domain-containing protein [Bacillota bacterium]
MLNLTIVDTIATMTLLVMTLLVYENSRLEKDTKKKFYFSCFFIFIAMFSEWAGLMLNGSPIYWIGIHKLVKCMDYIFTPVAGYMIVAQVTQKERVHNIVRAILYMNTALQLVSIFTGWTFYVDGQNVYHHGKYYIVYAISYLLIMASVFIEFFMYGKQYKKTNRGSLVSIFIIVVLAIFFQEVLGYRVSYLMLSIATAFLFVHYSEFSQLLRDESLSYQKEQLETDPLSSLYSRYAYTEDLEQYTKYNSISDSLVVFSIDINELKSTNDRFGHLAGDELIKGAAFCIKKILGEYGKCYRTGGDEFIAFLNVDPSKAYELKMKLIHQADQWKGNLIETLSLSVGYASSQDNNDVGIEKLIQIADEKMYESKARFYLQANKQRRKNEEIDAQESEYTDIIGAFASDVSGLYVIDRKKKEATAYRVSASDHRIRSGVPLEQGFDTAMEHFIEKNVYPDDRALMRQSVQMHFIEEELSAKNSFTYHFRTLMHGEMQFHYMKCMRNVNEDNYDKIIISFCPETNIIARKSVQQVLQLGEIRQVRTVLLVHEFDKRCDVLVKQLENEFNVLTIQEGQEALDLLKEHYNDISIILYQQNTEDLSILEFLKIMQKNALLYSIPVVVLNDLQDEKTEQASFELGAVDVFRSPYNMTVVKNRVKNIIRMNQISGSLNEIEMDDLTNVYTKQAFYYHAKMLIDASPNQSFTIIISDIQNFKIYNAVYGENKGDELLKSIAKLIRKKMHNGIYARYGADQFVAIIKKSDHYSISAEMEKINQDLKYYLQENVVLKFGIYENVDRNISVARMCDRAIFALKSIKHNYGRFYACFDEPVSQRLYKAQMYETKFRKALENQEFVVWYQPKFDLHTRKIVGAEALVRWQQNDEQLMLPSEFLPDFEVNGLIRHLDEYVFRTTCAYQKQWKESGKPLIPISVNLSRSSIYQSNVAQRYKQIIEEYDISPKIVPIEITESAAVGNVEIKPLADAFIQAGFTLEMDDFGAGKSSMAGLAMMHFNTIKLDKSLIDCIGEEQGNLVLMYTVALGKELGLRIVAEGVENEKQLDYLKDIGCEIVQGYYFSPPLAKEEFEKAIIESEAIEIEDGIEYGLTAADTFVRRAMDRMISKMPGGFFTYRNNAEERILSSNPYLWKMYGCESEKEFLEYVGYSFKGMVCSEDIKMVEAYIDQQIQDSSLDMDYVEYSIRRKDGTKIRVVDYGHLEGDIFYVFISEANK